MIRFTPALILAAVAVLPVGTPSAAAQVAWSARTAAMGGAATALPAESGGAANPAAWSASEHPVFGLDAAQLYGMTELRAGSAHLLWPLRRNAFVVGAATFGFDLYRETTLSVGVSRAFRPGTFRPVHAGLQFAFSTIQIDGYGSAGRPGLTAGFLLPVLPNILLGAVAKNIAVFGSSLRDQADRSLSLGISIRKPDGITLTTDLVKEIRLPADVRIGLEVRPVSALALRGGLTTDPPRLAAGLGLRTDHLSLDLAGERHYALGWSPILSVRIRW